jgi:hypothetical protein
MCLILDLQFLVFSVITLLLFLFGVFIILFIPPIFIFHTFLGFLSLFFGSCGFHLYLLTCLGLKGFVVVVVLLWLSWVSSLAYPKLLVVFIALIIIRYLHRDIN